ncbi:MAG: hypothetical protein HY308_07620 [Gammaproteobacteria bacterium]|nr:hypothetical protein [Gammaproteobacteria bacterium]
MQNDLLRRFSISVLMLGLIGCGGGGGGGSDDGDAPASGVEYSGATTQASVSSSNARALSGSAYHSGSAVGGGTNGLASVTASVAPTTIKQRSLILANLLERTIDKIDVKSVPSQATAAVQQDEIAGSCGGTVRSSVNYNDSTGNFSGSLTFTNYCDEFVQSVSGAISFSGRFNVATDDMISLSASMTSLSVTDDGDSYVIQASTQISFSDTGAAIAVTQTFNIRDASGVVCRGENVVLTVGDFGSYTEVRIDSGRFYHPSSGYVDVQTPMAFHVNTGQNYPSSGSLIITGANGSNARLIANSDGTYQLQVDADGIGGYETTLTGNWVDL